MGIDGQYSSNTIIMVLRQHTHAGKEDVLKELRPSLFRLSQVPCKAQERVRTLETPQCWREQHQCEILARWRGRSSVTRRKRANHSRPTTRPQSLSHVNRDISHKARPPKMGLNDSVRRRRSPRDERCGGGGEGAIDRFVETTTNGPRRLFCRKHEPAQAVPRE